MRTFCILLGSCDQRADIAGATESAVLHDQRPDLGAIVP